MSAPILSGTYKIIAAIVTYNRLKLLQRSVQALRNQTVAPAEILVVDNSSTDGTREWLAGQEGLTVIRQPNSGGAGGFHRATKYGYEAGFDWIWMMDDDTIPNADALEHLLASPVLDRADTGFVYSLQIYSDGTVPPNDPGPTGPQEWALKVLSERCIPVKQCSFVAFMVSRRAVAKIGYPLKEMFFMFDDAEYTRRTTDAGFRGFCVLDSLVLHDTKPPSAYDIRSWSPIKKRYSSRNEVYLIKTSSYSSPRKAWRLMRLFSSEIISLLKRRSSFSVIYWALKGFFFSPTVERPARGF